DSRDQGGCGDNERRATTAMGHLPLVWSRRWHTDSWRCIGLLNKAEATFQAH
ncbi:hypothetical protein BJ165DRAFT_1511111, partial [Panaeolus papilionaceus]